MHFTYRLRDIPEDLGQGDLLSQEGLSDILKVVHPHYLGSEYTHFVVLTQSCDLVRREANTCKSRYITLAAVRPAETVLQREIDKYQDEFARKGVLCSQKKRGLLEQLLARLLNNNESDYFFLRRDDSIGLHDDSCAFLRLSIAVRSYEHYDACRLARVVSLTEPFQAKLGWLVGNMYSRIGTEDWTPEHVSKEEFNQLIAGMLDQLCMWVDDAKLKRAKSTASANWQSEDVESIRTHVKSVSVISRREEILNRVEALLAETGLATNQSNLKAFRTRLGNDPEFARVAK